MTNFDAALARQWAGYVCRSCGYVTSYPGRFRKCPVCGIKWG